MSFELNCKYYSHIFYEENVNPYSKSKAADKLTEKLRNFIVVYKENLQYAK